METKDLEKEPVEQLKLKVGARYIHNKTSNEYVIDNITKMKHPDTGKWIPAVIYQIIGPNLFYPSVVGTLGDECAKPVILSIWVTPF